MLKPKILLIENNPGRRKDILEVLEKPDINVVSAKSVKEVQKHINSDNVVAIIGNHSDISTIDHSAGVQFVAYKTDDNIGTDSISAIILEITYHPQNILNAVALATESWQLRHNASKSKAEIDNLRSTLSSTEAEFDSFQYIVSHDLRAPLRAMNGYAQILVEDHASSVSENAARMLGRIRTNVTKLERQLDDLLAYSRANRAEIRYESVNMEKLVRQLFKNSAVNPELVINDLKPAYADKNLMQQVWAQLISNIAKFAKNDHPLVVEAGSSENDGTITYYIKDNGVGFEMQFAARIFDVFQKLHNSPDIQGNGMGLAVVKSIITKHGGDVWIESEPEIGTTIYFTLPTKKSLKH